MIEINKIKPIHLIHDICLEQFTIALLSAKNTNKLIQALRPLQTLPTDTHFLKRVRKAQKQQQKVQMILCLQKDQPKLMPTIKQAIQEYFKQEHSHIIQQTYDLKLPRYSPLSKEQYEKWIKYWPCNFLEPEYIKQAKHSNQQIEVIKKYLQKKQNQKGDTFFTQSSCENIAIFNHREVLFQLQKNQNQSKNVEEKNAQIKQTKAFLQLNCNQNADPLDHAIMRLAAEWPKCNKFLQSDQDYYYFTGLRILLKGQHFGKTLCGMCCMALVHSRAERVYFIGKDDPAQHIQRILYCPQLNHKIQMFLIKLQQEVKEDKK